MAVGALRSPSPFRHPREPTTLVSLGRWAGGQVPTWQGVDCKGLRPLLAHFPLCPGHWAVLGSGQFLVLRSWGLLGKHLSCGCPELNVLSWVSFSVFPPISLAQYIALCVLLSPLSSMPPASWGNTVLVARGPAREVRIRHCSCELLSCRLPIPQRLHVSHPCPLLDSSLLVLPDSSLLVLLQ